MGKKDRQEGLANDSALYNSRIISTFIDHLQKSYPDVDIPSVLDYAGMTIYELQDQGHWFSQRQVDLFHEILLQKTGNNNIAREAGRYLTSSQTSGGLRQFVLGFITPASAYFMLEKIAPNLTNASTIKTKQIAGEKVEITFSPKPGVQEKPYQCDNRIGMLESMGRLFTNRLAKIEHPHCLHQGGKECLYIATWEKSPFLVLNQIRNYLAVFSPVAILGLFFIMPSAYWMTFIFSCILMVLGLSFYSKRIETKELVKNIEGQGSAANELLDEINIRYNNALLIKEIGQAASRILDIDELLVSIMHTMETLLDFDRGMIMLANDNQTSLIYSIGYGYSPEHESILRNSQFDLVNLRSKGVAVRAFKEQRAFLVSDISRIEENISERSMGFAKAIGTKSFICVPIAFEGKAQGVLFVDNLHSKKSLNQSDMSLLMGIAPQIAISIHNARSYQEIQESKKRERNLRQLFEKYVPAPIIKRYLGSQKIDLFGGEATSITAIFLDIRGFTASSETMGAGTIVSFLNAYFEKCSDIISKGHGHINKYTGDGFLAIFGAPEPLKQHTKLAFDAACKIIELYGSFVLGSKPIEVGIGLHTGSAVLGNIGSQTKIEYTAVGDTVNIAARLQDLSRNFRDYPIILSRNVWEELAEHPYYDMISYLGVQEVRGKKEELETFGINPLRTHFSPMPDNEDGFLPLHRIKGV